MKRKNTLALNFATLAAVVALVGCTATGSELTRAVEFAAAGDTVEIPPLYPTRYPSLDPAPAAEPPLEFLLRERTRAPAGDSTPVVRPAAAALSGAESAALFARLPEIGGARPAAFAFPSTSPPPPRAGVTIHPGFPAADTTSPVERPVTEPAGPLAVLRLTPDGETELAPHLTVVFSQPMVPLTSVAGTDERDVPVRLSPEVEGRWRWIDTRTLRFEPEIRFPMATLFTVEVPAGVTSQLGGVFPQLVTHEFSTPAPRATGGFPHDARADVSSGVSRPPEPFWLRPVIVVAFDQRVDETAVIRASRMMAAGRQLPFRQATEREIRSDPEVLRLVEQLEPGRWIAVRPARELPRDAEIRFAIGPGAHSEEGTRAATAVQLLRFRTYAPLRVQDQSCPGVGRAEECVPRGAWMIHFNNPLDTAAWRPDLVRVEPAVEGMQVRLTGNFLWITGDTRPRTSYRVTLDPRIRDHWGQTLGDSRALTFQVGDPLPLLRLPASSMLVLDPAGPAIVRVQSRSHEALLVAVYRVAPEDWDSFAESLGRHRQEPNRTPFVAPGQRVVQTTIRPAGGASGFSEVPIDIGPALVDGLGHAVLVVESANPLRQRPYRSPYDRSPAIVWVQATRIGLSVMTTGTELTAWVTSLEDGRPLAGAEVLLLASGSTGRTADDGTARIPLTGVEDGLLVARKGSDVAILANHDPAWGPRSEAGWRLELPLDRLAWYVATDRGLYRPGERAQVKGWIRRIEGGPNGDVAGVPEATGVSFAVHGPRKEELQQGTTGLTGLSGFDFELDLPESVNLGHAELRITAEGSRLPKDAEIRHHLQIQEFRRPEYEVGLELDAGPHVVGSTLSAQANAAYYGGGGLPDTEVEWRVRSSAAHFTPPGWDRWRFGRLPWWGYHGREPALDARSLAGRTGADGAHHLEVDLVRAVPPFTTNLAAEVEVRDVNRQVGSASSSVLVHPAMVYVGLRTDRGWVRPGDTLAVEIAGVHLTGEAIANLPVRVWTETMDEQPLPRHLGDAAAALTTEREHCRLVTRLEPVACTVAIEGDRSLRLVAEIRDEADRPSRTELLVWVAGGPRPPVMPQAPGTLTVELIADREEYQPGDTAEILVQPPFSPAEGVLTIRRSGLLRTERFRVSGASHVLRVPVDETMLPGVHLHVELVDVRRGVRSAAGQLQLSVPPRRRELAVAVVPGDSVVVPGAQTHVEIEVRDADGRPVPHAEVAMWMVDEAVLAMGRYTLPDPLEAFYPAREPGVRDHGLRSSIVLARVSAGPGTLSGTVLNAEMGNPLWGARVTVTELDVSARVGPSGEFTLSPVPPGRHRLQVTIDGLAGVEYEIDVEVPAEGLHMGAILIAPGSSDVVAVGYGVARVGLPPAAPPLPVIQARQGDAAQDIRIAEVTFDGGAGPVGAEPIELRTEFAPLAAFEPALRTGADGRVAVLVRVPESITRYRVMAVAVQGAQLYGRGEGTVTARRELVVRPSAPRFLNFGDRAEIPVVVQNTTANPLVVDVGLRSAGLEIEGPAGHRITVPAGDRVEVRFTARADLVGRVRLQAVASAGHLSDAAAVELPVYTPATSEAFATYGEIDRDTPVAIPVAMPDNVIPGFGGLEVTVSSTAVQALTDAVLYLESYPFEGAEQLASRILGIAALRDVLHAFAAEGLPPPEQLDSAVARDIGRLVSLQTDDGGWSLWRGGERTHPYVSIHAAHALVRARGKGYTVPAEPLDRAIAYLRAVDGSADREYTPRHREALKAYARYVRGRFGDGGVAAEARRAVQDVRPELLSTEAIGWLLHTIAADPGSAVEAAELTRRLRNRASETAATASFTSSYTDSEHLLFHSDRRSDAIVLEALIAADPTGDLIPKTARGLLANRVSGRWRTTQENAWVLLALERYFSTYEATTPSFRSHLWLGERYAGGHEFRGRTTDRLHVEIPMQSVPNGATDSELLLRRDGEGRMYYRAGIRYAPINLTPDPDQRGFSVERSYEAVDADQDVRRDPDGSWRVRAGARVRVRLSMLAPERRYHVALVDPIPAGFEPLNPELAGTGFTDDATDVPGPPVRRLPVQSSPRPGIWPTSWWVHQNMRDDRAEVFATLLPAGSYEYTYLTRATTPGTFVVPPPRAEELYSPETFGRGAGVRVTIE